MGKIAFLFSGQGAQKIGMGQELHDNFNVAKAVFDEACDSLNFDVKKMIFDGDDDALMVTDNAQPCILTVSIAALRVLEREGISADATAGLSLGEYSAHVCSKSIGFNDAVGLVRKRGKYMLQQVAPGVGGMVAIIGMDEMAVRALCAQCSSFGVVEPSNFNCPGQITLSGEVKALKKACELAKKEGYKKSCVLSVNTPFHCTMLKGAGEKLREDLKKIPIADMQIPVAANVSGQYINSKHDIVELLVKQVWSPVMFELCVRRMLDDGVSSFVELGPGRILSKFVKKINSEVEVYNVEDVASLEKTLKGLKK